MAVVGIVAEYDPFHLGHAWQIAEVRRRLGADTGVVCVMSGSWTQRGSCALTDKWTRSALALRGGADLVLELPAPWAISSAEGFARGAVSLLRATGVVDTLSFGSESGDGPGLAQIARALEGEEYRAALREGLDRGLPFASARQEAALRAVGEKARYLRGANDSLGVEYLRAAAGAFRVLAIPRRGTAHDSDTPGEGFASASHIRALARAGEWEAVAGLTPPGTVEALQGAGIAHMAYIERAMLARLRVMGEADFAALPDGGGAEGLPRRLVRAAGEAGSLEEFYDLAKTKRYAHARLRRLALWAFLGLTGEDRPAAPAYLRVLGFGPRGQALLKEMKGAASLPILTKPAHARELDGGGRALFAAECRCTDLYGLCFPTPRPRGLDYTTGPVRVAEG